MIDTSVSGHFVGDCRDLLKQLPSECVQTCITSPPYWGLRDYGHDGQLGLEATPDEYVSNMVAVFREVRRVLRGDGTLWLNLGDSYCNTDKWGGGGSNTGKQTVAEDGSVPSWAVRKRKAPISGVKPKDLVGIPWAVAFALRTDGWYLRSDVIWHKPNPMPESVTDRPTKAHEYLFLLSKAERYCYDHDAILEPFIGQNEHDRGGGRYAAPGQSAHSRQTDKRGAPDATGRNKRSVWTVATQPYDGAHFATFPPSLIEPCVLACSRVGDIVLDPFFGSGTTGQVAEKHGRRWIGFDINPAYEQLQRERTAQRSLVIGGQP